MCWGAVAAVEATNDNLCVVGSCIGSVQEVALCEKLVVCFNCSAHDDDVVVVGSYI